MYYKENLNKNIMATKIKKTNKGTKSKNINSKSTSLAIDDSDVIVFSTKMRKTFVEGVLQDIKGYFECKTDGKVSITYENCDMNSYDFGFKLYVSKNGITKQKWSEVTSAIVNLVNYMFPESSSFDIISCTNDDNLEVEIISIW